MTKNRISTSIIVDLVSDDIRAMPSMTPIQVRSLVRKSDRQESELDIWG